MQDQQPVPAPDEIWRILKEVSASQKRHAMAWEKLRQEMAEEQKRHAKRQAEDRKRQAEDRKRQAEDQKRQDMAWEKQRRDLAESRKRLDLAWEKRRRELAEQQAESSRRLDREIEKTNKAIRESDGKMDNRWGNFVEALTVGKLKSQLQERGIMVCNISQNETGSMITSDSSDGKERKNCEIDIIAKNKDDLVAVEVKSALSKAKVDRFLRVLEDFHEMFPSYQRMRVRGAVAFLSEKKGAAAYAESKGLFVIKAVGDSSRITNKKSFKPKVFCSPCVK